MTEYMKVTTPEPGRIGVPHDTVTRWILHTDTTCTYHLQFHNVHKISRGQVKNISIGTTPPKKYIALIYYRNNHIESNGGSLFYENGSAKVRTFLTICLILAISWAARPWISSFTSSLSYNLVLYFSAVFNCSVNSFLLCNTFHVDSLISPSVNTNSEKWPVFSEDLIIWNGKYKSATLGHKVSFCEINEINVVIFQKETLHIRILWNCYLIKC